MRRGLIIFLQAVVVFIGIGAISLLLWEPHLEGRNVNATLFEIYFKDPFLAYVYLGSIPFFVALYQAFRILRLVGQSKSFSPETVKRMRTIEFSALITAGAIAAADIYLYLFIALPGKDDAAGAISLGIIATFICFVVASLAKMFEGILKNGVIRKSENDSIA